MFGLLGAELAPVVVAGAFGVGGVVVGIGGTILATMLTRSHAREAWRNEQRLAAYVRTYEDVLTSWDWLSEAARDAEWAADNMATGRDLMGALVRDSASIVILGPDAVTTHLSDMIDAMGDLIGQIGD